MISPAVGRKMYCRDISSNFEGITNGTECIFVITNFTACGSKV